MVTGMVEEFGERWIEGWVAVPRGAPPLEIRLQVNQHQLMTTWAAGSVKRSVPGNDVRGFRIPTRSLWNWVGKNDHFRVLVGDQALPIAGAGTRLAPKVDGAKTVDQLLAKLDEGYLFDRTGLLQFSRSIDQTWQRVTLVQTDRVREFLAREFAIDVFFLYGTLLGAVREKGPIAHDSDIDLGYASTHTDPGAAADELAQIASALIAAGFRVVTYRHHLRIADEIDGVKDVHVDLFHTYFNDKGVLRFPYGVAGRDDVLRSDWAGVQEAPFAAGTGPVPVCAEKVVVALYGRGWRYPQPGFNWDLDRRSAAKEAWLSAQAVDELFWTDYYTSAAPAGPSSLATALLARDDLPEAVVDLGCGEGRDAFAFAAAGRTVVGLDRASAGLDLARARETPATGSLEFVVGDLADAGAVAAAIDQARTTAGRPVLVHLRFVLHALRKDDGEALLAALHEHVRTGDVLAVEFRTTADEDRPKASRPHFRRYIDSAGFREWLGDGYDVLDEVEGTGLAPYGREDPELYRVVARRR